MGLSISQDRGGKYVGEEDKSDSDPGIIRRGIPDRVTLWAHHGLPSRQSFLPLVLSCALTSLKIQFWHNRCYERLNVHGFLAKLQLNF